MAQAGQTDQ